MAQYHGELPGELVGGARGLNPAPLALAQLCQIAGDADPAALEPGLDGSGVIPWALLILRLHEYGQPHLGGGGVE